MLVAIREGISAAMVMVMARTVPFRRARLHDRAAARPRRRPDRRDLPGGIFIPSSPPFSKARHGRDLRRELRPHAAAALVPLRRKAVRHDARRSGGAIGLVKGAIFERTLRDATLVPAGEQLVFFTDGVNEAMDEKNEEYGDKKLLKMLKTNGEAPAADLVQSLVDSVLYHRGDAPASDDITVLAVRRKQDAVSG